jgi:hypothetical protein
MIESFSFCVAITLKQKPDIISCAAMKQHKLEIVLASLFLGAFVAFWLWQNPSLIRGKLRADEIDRYLTSIDRQVQQPQTQKQHFLARLRSWAEADDGKPVYMLNLMRFYDTLRRSDVPVDFQGTPEESNAFYERQVAPLLVKRGGYPSIGGKAEGKNLVGFNKAADDWSRVLMVRYPDRRAFLSLLADPAYGPLVPYKMMAVELVLVPVAGDVVIPDLRVAFGGVLLIAFLTIAWFRAIRRSAKRPLTTAAV